MNNLVSAQEALKRAKELIFAINPEDSNSRLRGLTNARNELDIANRRCDDFLNEYKEGSTTIRDIGGLLTYDMALKLQRNLWETTMEIDRMIAQERLIRALTQS